MYLDAVLQYKYNYHVLELTQNRALLLSTTLVLDVEIFWSDQTKLCDGAPPDGRDLLQFLDIAENTFERSCADFRIFKIYIHIILAQL